MSLIYPDWLQSYETTRPALCVLYARLLVVYIKEI
jgi:hypothetical protein